MTVCWGKRGILMHFWRIHIFISISFENNGFKRFWLHPNPSHACIIVLFFSFFFLYLHSVFIIITVGMRHDVFSIYIFLKIFFTFEITVILAKNDNLSHGRYDKYWYSVIPFISFYLFSCYDKLHPRRQTRKSFCKIS